MRILVAEDDPSLGPTLKKGLEDSRYEEINQHSSPH